MKTELIVFGIIAVVASSFLNADSTRHTQPKLAETKLRIEKAADVYAQSQQVKKVATIKKPSEG